MHTASLKRAVTVLHAEGFVFRDLRTPTVLLVYAVVRRAGHDTVSERSPAREKRMARWCAAGKTLASVQWLYAVISVRRLPLQVLSHSIGSGAMLS